MVEKVVFFLCPQTQVLLSRVKLATAVTNVDGLSANVTIRFTGFCKVFYGIYFCRYLKYILKYTKIISMIKITRNTRRNAKEILL